MNIVFPFILLLIYLLSGTIPTKRHNYREISDTVNWNVNRKLEWGDFQGPPQINSKFSAETHYAITYSYRKNGQHKNPQLLFKVQSFFEKDRSWAKPNDINEQLLEHEQAHFDIAELHTRIFRERISKTHFDEKKYDQQIQKMFLDILAECKQMQELFDSETKSGVLSESQNNWIIKIKNALDEYDIYKKITIQSMAPHANNSL